MISKVCRFKHGLKIKRVTHFKSITHWTSTFFVQAITLNELPIWIIFLLIALIDVLTFETFLYLVGQVLDQLNIVAFLFENAG